VENVAASRGRVLVTGASKGIGRAIAERLAHSGWEVIGTCRDPRALPVAERVKGVSYLPLDLSRESSVAALARKVGRVDVLVNNAGESPVGPAEEFPLGRVRSHFEVNFFGPVRLTQVLVRPMRERGRGTIIFIGSIRSEAPTPFSSFYSASKSALRSFAGCLRLEVKQYGVRVAVIAPWHVRTTLSQEMQVRRGSPYREALERVKADRDRRIAAAPDPRSVADAVEQVIAAPNPKPFSTVGKPILSLLMRLAPRGFVERISARMVKLHGAAPGRIRGRPGRTL